MPTKAKPRVSRNRLSPPALQRQMVVGCKGGDVLAVQRALYVALRQFDAKATNLRSGEYGTRTTKDVQNFQRQVKLNASGKVGLPTLLALWNRIERYEQAGAFDDYGIEQLYRLKLGKPTNLKDGELKKGSTGPHVTALQRMLWRSLGGDSKNARNGVYGDGVIADMREFYRRANRGERSPLVVTQEDWEILWPFGDERAYDLATAKVSTPEQAVRQAIRSWGEWYVQNRARISYRQVRPYPRTGILPIRTDCSGSAHHILKMAGCPNDPSGRGFDGQGYTGTMYQRGNRISLSNLAGLLPGDCVFYGNQGGGVPSHVNIVIGPGDRALNFGHWPPSFVFISSYWRTNLRTDVGARRYF